MSDPSWSDETRDAIHSRLGAAMVDARMIRQLIGHYHPQNGKWLLRRVAGDENQFLSQVKLNAGVLFTDTDKDGLIYLTATDETPGAGQVRLQFYRDSGKSTLVAQLDLADGASGTLTPQTGYGIGSETNGVTVGTVSASFNGVYKLIPPRKEQIEAAFEGAERDDVQTKSRLLEQLDQIYDQLLQLEQLAQGMAPSVVNAIVRRNLRGITESSALLAVGLDRPGSTGRIRQRTRGLIEDLRRNQASNTGGSGEVKAAAGSFGSSSSVVSAGSYDATVTGPTLGDQVRPGVFTLTCVAALSANSAPRFRVVFDADDQRLRPNQGNGSQQLQFELTIGAEWKAPQFGVESLTIDYKASITQSASAVSATSGDWTVSNLRSGNSDNGKLWGKVVSGVLKFYNNETDRDAGGEDGLVAQVTSPGTSSSFVTDDADSGIVINGATGGTVNSDDTFEVDFRPPTPETEADQILVTLTQSAEPSEWVKAVRDGAVGGQGWEPNTGSSPNLEDGYISAGNVLTGGLLGDLL